MDWYIQLKPTWEIFSTYHLALLGVTSSGIVNKGGEHKEAV